MANLTAERSTIEGLGNTIVGVVGSSVTVYAGALVGVNTSGKVVPAADKDITVLGRAEKTASDGASVTVKVGTFLWDNDTTSACAATDIGKDAYVVDDHTVAISGATVTSGHFASKAGKILQVTDGGVLVRTSL